MKNYKIKTSFVTPEGPKAWANTNDINFSVLLFIASLLVRTVFGLVFILKIN